jgi:hypothetical protein
MCSCTDPPTLPRLFGTWHALLRSLNSVPNPDPPDPHVFGPPGSGSFYQQARIVRKTLILLSMTKIVRGMDLRIRIRIHTKMSWIRNIVSQQCSLTIILCYGVFRGGGRVAHCSVFANLRSPLTVEARIRILGPL